MNRFHTDNMIIRDELGRQRIFRGVNFCIKSQRIKKSSFHDFYNHIDKLEENGINIIRFGVTWAAIEPEESRFDDKAISFCREFVQECKKRNIYVMLDMHQDLFTGAFMFGDGAPKWVLEKGLKIKKPFAIWAEGYFYMDSVQKCFYDFWNNKNNIQDKFVSAWSYYLDSFKDLDNIIGFDYLNEPFIHENGRKVFLQLLTNISKIAGINNLNLSKYYNNHTDKTGFAFMALKLFSLIKTKKALIKLLNKMDSKENFDKAVKGLEKYTDSFNQEHYQSFIDNISSKVYLEGGFKFFEHNYYCNLGIPFSINTKDDYIYSPHAYDIFIDSPLYSKYSSDGRIESILLHIRENQEKMNVPVVFGEWGGSGNRGGKWIEHIDYIIGIFEKYQWSNIYWNLIFDDKKLIDIFNRPYPVAIYGNIIEYKTDSKERNFTLIWEQDKDFDENIIYINEKGFIKQRGKKGINKIEIKY